MAADVRGDGDRTSLQQLLQAEAVTPDDFAATILHAFGLAPETTLEDPTGRSVQISTGTPVTALF